MLIVMKLSLIILNPYFFASWYTIFVRESYYISHYVSVFVNLLMLTFLKWEKTLPWCKSILGFKKEIFELYGPSASSLKFYSHVLFFLRTFSFIGNRKGQLSYFYLIFRNNLTLSESQTQCFFNVPEIMLCEGSDYIIYWIRCI